MAAVRASRRRAASKSTAPKSTVTLVLIALFKLIKGVALILVGIGALKLLHHDVATTVAHWVDVLRVDPDNRTIHALLARVLLISPAQLRAASVGTFFYAALLLTEGTGLLLRQGKKVQFSAC